ncbi:MAG TPA: hypothetical protein DF715_10455 [Oceanicaulis sp.]|jgi:FkbM family methyltransferase|nr:FkbM family methyltransferase [Synechococcus moorigangaii CMS01]HCY55920.1 hypothetical protein [Oceanicaulis sp.]
MNKTNTPEHTETFEEMDEAAASREVAPTDPGAAHGRFRPGIASRLGMAIGRALPPGRTGLKLAGIARPLAMSALKDGVADIEALGLKLRLHPMDNLSEKRAFLTPQCFDVVELEALRAAMGPGKTFIDIGANAGLYSLVAAKAGGRTARVIAVEPQDEMRRRLAYNARANGLENIEISGVALADYEGESVMRLIGHNRGGTQLAVTDDGAAGRTTAVRVAMLTTLLSEMRVTRLDVMKIDVEGGELAILAPFFANAPREIWPDMIIMERPAINKVEAARDALSLACSRGYRVETETHANAILKLARTEG